MNMLKKTTRFRIRFLTLQYITGSWWPEGFRKRVASISATGWGKRLLGKKHTYLNYPPPPPPPPPQNAVLLPGCKQSWISPYGKKLQNYSNYSPMLNWLTIGGTIAINGQKLLKFSNYSPMLKVCAVKDALIWYRNLYLISSKIRNKKFVDCGIYAWHIFCH